jgi:hypothetical protein
LLMMADAGCACTPGRATTGKSPGVGQTAVHAVAAGRTPRNAIELPPAAVLTVAMSLTVL